MSLLDQIVIGGMVGVVIAGCLIMVRSAIEEWRDWKRDRQVAKDRRSHQRRRNNRPRQDKTGWGRIDADPGPTLLNGEEE